MEPVAKTDFDGASAHFAKQDICESVRRPLLAGLLQIDLTITRISVLGAHKQV